MGEQTNELIYGMIPEFAQFYNNVYLLIAGAIFIIGILALFTAKGHSKEILTFLGGSEVIVFAIVVALPPLATYEQNITLFFINPFIVAVLDLTVIGAIFSGLGWGICRLLNVVGSKRVRNLPSEWAKGICLVTAVLAGIPGVVATLIPSAGGYGYLILGLSVACAGITGLWYALKTSETVQDWWEYLRAQHVPSFRSKAGAQTPLPRPVASFPTYNPKKEATRRGDQYLGRVRVTLGPSSDASVILPPRSPADSPKPRTFLQDFLPKRGNPRIYGVELARDNGHSWTFFARGRDAEEAQMFAAGILQRLKEEFAGLDGVADVIRLSKEYLAQRGRFVEVRLPRPPFHKAALLETLAQLNPGHPFRVYLVFRKAMRKEYNYVRSRLDYGADVDDAGPRTPHDAVEVDSAKLTVDEWKEDLFAARMFVQAEVPTSSQESDLRGTIQEVLGHVENTRGFHARARDVSRIFARVISCARQVDFDRFLTARVVDFDFPASIRIPRGWVDEDERFTPILGLRDDSPGYLVLGDALRNGAASGQKLAVQDIQLNMHTAILGGTGKGKTRFLLYLLHKLWKDHHLPMVIINFAKEEHQKYFPHDHIFRFPSADFELPYFVDPGLPPAKRKKFLSMAGMNIAYMLGLAEWELVPMTFRYVLRTEKDPPKTLADLFAKVRVKLDRRKYSQKTQADIIASVENRMDDLRDRTIVRCTQLLAPGRLPKWFELWRAGKAVVLDISACGDERAFVLLCILLTFYAAVPLLDKEHQERVRGFLVADEVQDLIGNSASKDPKSAMYQIAARIGELFDTFLREFRERGVGVMVVSQNIENLPKTAYDIPNLKILFQLDKDSANHFAISPRQVKIINELQARQAFVHNAHTGDKCYIQTPDFNLPDESPETPAKESQKTTQCLKPVTKSLIPHARQKAKGLSLKELFRQVKKQRTVWNPRLTHATVQSSFRLRALHLSERGRHVAGFNIIFALWANAGVALLGESGHPATTLKGILQRLHAKARPDKHLLPGELAAFYEAGETGWRLLQQAKRGKLQPGDVQAFDTGLERIFRDFEFCLSRILQRQTEAREKLPAKSALAKGVKRKKIQTRKELAIRAPRGVLKGTVPLNHGQAIANTNEKCSHDILRWFQDSLQQNDANGAYLAVFAYWVPKLRGLSAKTSANEQPNTLSELVENIIQNTITSQDDQSVEQMERAAILNAIKCLEAEAQTGTLQDTVKNAVAVRGLFFAMKDLFRFCAGFENNAGKAV